jgi:hypothetical protein
VAFSPKRGVGVVVSTEAVRTHAVARNLQMEVKSYHQSGVASAFAAPTKRRSLPSWPSSDAEAAPVISLSPPRMKNRSFTTSTQLLRRRKKNKLALSSTLVVALLCFCLAFLRALVYVSHHQWSYSQIRIHRLKPPTWKNRHDLVHVVQTRFMQFQPNLIELGRARLRLFAAVTLPSVVQQSQSEFLWIIRTDPNLDQSLRNELIAMVASYNNIVLVGSNENPEGFKGDGCIADLLSSSNGQSPIWAGSISTVQSFHEAARSHIVLETRLDADDALLLDFVEIVQVDAAQRLTRDWIVWCAKNHMEWQYESPWVNDTETGALVGLNAMHCVTPGLTWGYSVGVDRTSVTVSQHQQIHEVVRACVDAPDAASDEQGDANDSKKRYVDRSRCLVRVHPPNKFPLVLRARCPTSAGMERVFTGGVLDEKNDDVVGRLQHSRWKNSQEELFGQLPVLFGIQAQDLFDVRAYLTQHLSAILTDALVGQCTKGHSCKGESKILLKNLLDASTKRQDRHDPVETIE